VWELTARDTGGAYTLFDTYVEPGGAVASAHVHPYQTEIFTVVEGRLGVKRGRETLELGPGEVALIDPGTPHRFWNAGNEALRFRAEVRPALEFESRSRRCSASPPTGRRTARACRARFGWR
jgi:mannose-6-phosphate isomerase-like protein (cupin superfamily)